MKRLNFQNSFFGKPAYNKGGVLIPDNDIKFKVADYTTGHCVNNHLKCLLHQDIVDRNGGWTYLAKSRHANEGRFPRLNQLNQSVCLFLDAEDFDRHAEEFQDDPVGTCQRKTKQQKALEGICKNASSQFKRKFTEIYALHNPEAAPLVNISNSQISDSLGITQVYPVTKKTAKTQPTESQSVSNSEIATKVSKIFKSHNLTQDRIEKVLKIVELDYE